MFNPINMIKKELNMSSTGKMFNNIATKLRESGEYNEECLLALAFSTFWNISNSNDKNLLHMFLYQYVSGNMTYIPDAYKYNNIILFEVLDNYYNEGITKDNLFKIEYLIYNFFSKMAVEESTLLVYFCSYCLLISELNNKYKLNYINLYDENFGGYITDNSGGNKPIFLERLVSTFRKNIENSNILDKDEELESFIKINIPIFKFFYNYFICMYGKKYSGLLK